MAGSWTPSVTECRAARSRSGGISLNAVKYHARNIASKLGVADARELRRWPGQPIGSRVPAPREADISDTTLRLGPLGQVSLLARDTKRVERFYRDVLGLSHVFTFGDLAFFDADGVRIYVHTKPDKEWRPSSVLYFLVPDIAAAVTTLEERGVAFKGAPHLIHRDDATGDEEWMAFFEDEEGNLLALMSRVAAAAAAPATPSGAPDG